MPNANRSRRAQVSSIAAACSPRRRPRSRGVRRRRPAGGSAPWRPARARRRGGRPARPRPSAPGRSPDRCARGARARSSPGTTSATIARSEVPSARFSGIPSQPASSGTITSPPPMPEETGHEAGDGPDPSEDRGRRRRGLAAAARSRVSRRIATACQPRRRAVTTRSSVVSIEPVSQAPTAAPTMPGPTSQPAARTSSSPRRPVGERARERGREDHRQRRGEGDDRRRPEQRPGCRASSRCRRRPRTAPRARPATRPISDRRVAMSSRRHRSGLTGGARRPARARRAPRGRRRA